MSTKLLIVEDNKDTREILRHYFKNADFQVLTAEDGSEGLKKAKAEHPDLIVTDLNMPNLSGVEMIKQLHADSETSAIPVLVFTAMSSGMARDGMKAGAWRTFFKPFEFDALVDEVNELLQS
jgi:DNA-binding response OmpR family regulator